MVSNMRAHILNESGLILNTVVVNSLDDWPGYVDASIGGGPGDSIINGELVPKTVVVPVPAAVTMRQARLALLGAGLLDDVETALNALSEPAKSVARIEWDYSNELQRANPLVVTLGGALGLTSGQVDSLFITAAGL